MDDDELYRAEILEHFRSSPHRGQIEAPDCRAELDNPLCGDRIILELKLAPGGRIDRVRFRGDGCAISQASASLLAERIEGATALEARRLSAMDVLRLLAIPLTPARQKCGLLAWRALQKALPEPVNVGNRGA